MPDRVSRAVGKACSWLTLLMVVVTFVVVVMRYVFDAGLIGAAYTLQQEEHVRVDVFYRTMSNRRRAWVDLFGVMVFLLPLCAYLAWTSYDFVAASWGVREASRESGGLPYPLLPLLKSVLLLMPVAVALQGLSLCRRSLQELRQR